MDDQKTKSREILPITGLRAILAWWVVCFHFVDRKGLPDVVLRVLSRGHIAVDVFFVLSGYILARRASSAMLAGTAKKSPFYVRRFARVVPLYYASLAVGILAEPKRFLSDLVTQRGHLRLFLEATLLNAWSHLAMFRFNWAAWSLSVEALFYLLFPWILPQIARQSRRRLYAILIIAWLVTFIAPTLYACLDPDQLHHPLTPDDEVLWSWYLKFFPVLRVPLFVSGIVAARLWGERPIAAPASRVPWAAISAIALVSVAATDLLSHTYRLGGVLLPLVVALVVTVARSPSRLLASRPLLVFGHASYALYIVHVPVFLLIARFLPTIWESVTLRLVYLPVVAVVALLGHHLIEEPLRHTLTKRFAAGQPAS